MEINIGFISDTHTKHNIWLDTLKSGQWGYDLENKWKDLDLLIFAGDCSSRGYKHEVQDFLKWFSDQPATYKVMVSGNHDFLFEDIVNFDYEKPHHKNKRPPELSELIPDNVIYLNDSSVEILGLKIWGSPIQPWFYNWAFNRKRGEDIKKHWDSIPNDTDILITHGPPRGMLDRISPKFERHNEDPNVGCDDLLDAIKRVKPIINVFGHIHEGYGNKISDGVHYFNASCLNDNYRPCNPPQFLTIEV